MDKLVAMRTLTEIIDRGSLTKAAESLGKSLPTVVRTLAVLEQEVGVRLLARTTRTMSLTPEGREYLARARRILADVEEAETVLTAGRSEPQGSLKITAPVLFGQQHVAPRLVEFAERYPQISVDLVLLDRMVDLVEEGFDAAVRLAPLADSSMVAIRVGEVRRIVVASPDLLARVGSPGAPQALRESSCVLFGGIAPGDVWSFRDDGKELRVPVSGTFRTNNAAVALEACAAGLGFGQFLSYQALPLVREKRLEIVLSKFDPPAAPVSVVYPDARGVTTRLRAFLDWMRDGLRGEDYV